MQATTNKVLVWPWWQRALHWLLAGSVLLALASWHGGPWHEWAGIVAASSAACRIALGLLGPPIARFSSFVRGARDTWVYARSVAVPGGLPPRRHLNHNPLGGWMVVALLLLAVSAAFCGWLYTTDRFWGVAWVIEGHALLAWPLLALFALHLGGVLLAGCQHRENLIAAMLHGEKRVLEQDDGAPAGAHAAVGRPHVPAPSDESRCRESASGRTE